MNISFLFCLIMLINLEEIINIYEKKLYEIAIKNDSAKKGFQSSISPSIKFNKDLPFFDLIDQTNLLDIDTNNVSGMVWLFNNDTLFTIGITNNEVSSVNVSEELDLDFSKDLRVISQINYPKYSQIFIKKNNLYIKWDHKDYSIKDFAKHNSDVLLDAAIRDNIEYFMPMDTSLLDNFDYKDWHIAYIRFLKDYKNSNNIIKTKFLYNYPQFKDPIYKIIPVPFVLIEPQLYYKTSINNIINYIQFEPYIMDYDIYIFLNDSINKIFHYRENKYEEDTKHLALSALRTKMLLNKNTFMVFNSKMIYNYTIDTDGLFYESVFPEEINIIFKGAALDTFLKRIKKN